MIARTFSLLAGMIAMSTFAAEPIQMKPEQSWKGSSNDESKEKDIPKIITNAEKFAEAWKAFGQTDEVPVIDFKKSFVVVLTGRGSRINPRVMKTPEGEVKVLGIETRDFRPGFRWVAEVHSREGVKTVNGEAFK